MTKAERKEWDKEERIKKPPKITAWSKEKEKDGTKKEESKVA